MHWHGGHHGGRFHGRERDHESHWGPPEEGPSGRGRGKGGFGPPPPGFGGPHGRAHRGPHPEHGPRGARLFGPGDLRLVILALIDEQPRHGYEIIKAIEEQFQGAYAPSPGAVYPILTYLQDQDLIQEVADNAGGKRRYSITEAGQQQVAENRIVLDGILTRAGISARSMARHLPPPEVHQAVHTFWHALACHRPEWSREEGARVAQILLRAAREISEPPV